MLCAILEGHVDLGIAISWGGSLLIILSLLALDLCVFHRKDHTIEAREALLWSGFWIFISLCFGLVVYQLYNSSFFFALHDGTSSGQQALMQYITGYIIEQSLSLDNVFVIALILAYFHVPTHLQHRVLFWGVVGVLVLRGVMIVAGAALLHEFSWMTYVFGGILIVSAMRLLVVNEGSVDPEKNIFVRMLRRFYPVTTQFDGRKFFTCIDGKRAVTPLLLTLVVVESVDVLFAVDSIPAIFAITSDPFIVFTSNAFAVIGLRSLYFAIAVVMRKFRYIKVSLIFILAYVGMKMIITHHFAIPSWFSLILILMFLAIGIVASLGTDAAKRWRSKDFTG